MTVARTREVAVKMKETEREKMKCVGLVGGIGNKEEGTFKDKP